jgi:WD40 repeat protein
LRVWDVRQGAAKPTLQLTLAHEYLNLAWAPDGLTLATGSANLDNSDDAAKVAADGPARPFL